MYLNYIQLLVFQISISQLSATGHANLMFDFEDQETIQGCDQGVSSLSLIATSQQRTSITIKPSYRPIW